jgi:hypothetical protein
MSLIDHYELELLKAAGRLQQPARVGSSRRLLGAGRRGLAVAIGAGAALALLAAAILPLLAIMRGGEAERDLGAGALAGWYSSSVDIGRGGPKDTPRGGSLFLGAHGSYRLTAGAYRLKGRYAIDGFSAEFRGAGGYEPLPGLSTNVVPRPDPMGRCRGAVGTYRVRVGTAVRFELVSDTCRPRARTLTAKPWILGGRYG